MQAPIARFSTAMEEGTDVLSWWAGVLSGSFEVVQRGRQPCFSSGPVDRFYSADNREWCPHKLRYPEMRPVPGTSLIEEAGPLVVQFAPRIKEHPPFELFEVAPRWGQPVTQSNSLGVGLTMHVAANGTYRLHSFALKDGRPASDALDEIGTSLRNAWYNLNKEPANGMKEAEHAMDSAVRKVEAAKGVKRRFLDSAETIAKKPKGLSSKSAAK